MTTYKLQKSYVVEMDNTNGKAYNVEIFQVWEKFAKIPYYVANINGEQCISRYSKIQKRDVLNYIERYL